MLGELICRVVAFVFGAVAGLVLMYVVYFCVVYAWTLAGDYWDSARRAGARQPREALGQVPDAPLYEQLQEPLYEQLQEPRRAQQAGNHARAQSPDGSRSKRKSVRFAVWDVAVCNAVVVSPEQMQRLGRVSRQPDVFGVMVFRDSAGWRLPFFYGNPQDTKDMHASLDAQVAEDMGEMDRLCLENRHFQKFQDPDGREIRCRVAYLGNCCCCKGNPLQVFQHLISESRAHRQIGFAFYDPKRESYSVLSCYNGVIEIEFWASIYGNTETVLDEMLVD